MAQALRKKDIEDAKKISTIFSTLSEESKTIAVIYLSALGQIILSVSIFSFTEYLQWQAQEIWNFKNMIFTSFLYWR